MKHKLRICFEVKGLASDESGAPTPVGLEISFGETEKEIPYPDLVSSVDIPALLEHIGLTRTIKPEDLRLITPEEYEALCGDS